MRGGREQSDGSIVFPMKGPPPGNPPEGYIEDPNDPYRWIFVYCSCKHRVLNQDYICPSGRTRKRDFCNLLQLQINPRYCNIDCRVQDK